MNNRIQTLAIFSKITKYKKLIPIVYTSNHAANGVIIFNFQPVFDIHIPLLVTVEFPCNATIVYMQADGRIRVSWACI